MLPPIEWVKSISVSTVHPHHDAGHVDTVGSEYYSEVEICNRSRQVDDDCVRPVPGRDHGRWSTLTWTARLTCQQNVVKQSIDTKWSWTRRGTSGTPARPTSGTPTGTAPGQWGGVAVLAGVIRPEAGHGPAPHPHLLLPVCTDTTSWNTPTSLGRIRVSLNFSAFGCDSSPRGPDVRMSDLGLSYPCWPIVTISNVTSSRQSISIIDNL